MTLRTTMAAVTMTGIAMQAQHARAQDEGAQDPAVLPEIQVFGGARDFRDIFDTPNAVSVVGPEEIERRQPSTYEDLLGDVPGVTIEGGARGISHEPNIRGFRDEQIVIRVDGARQNFNSAHRGRFFTDPDILKRVEVLRGGASTLFGSGALGGVILLDTKDASDVVRPGEVWGGRVRTGFNSQGDELQTSATLAADAGAFDVLGFVAYRPMFSDLEDGAGDPIRNSEIDSLNALAKLGWEPSAAHRFEASWQVYDDQGQTPPNANVQGTSTNVVDRDLTYSAGRLEWSFMPESDLWDLNALFYFNDVDLAEDRIADGRADETQLTTLGVDVANISRIDLGLPTALSYGFEVYRDDREATRNGEPRDQSPDAVQTFAAVFGQAEVSLGRGVAITPGLRFDWFETDPETTFETRSDSQLSPRLALSWRPTEAGQLFVSASRSFRAPSTSELYNDGVHFSSDSFALDPADPNSIVFTGNNVFVPTPDLEPERALQFEIGTRWRFRDLARRNDRLTLAATAYYSDVEDFIDTTVEFINFDTTSFNPITGQVEVDGTTINRNVDAELWGVELEARYDAARWFAGAGLSIPRGEAKDGSELGSIPQDKLTFTAGWRPFRDVEIGARATFRDGTDAGEGTDGSSVFDLFATWRPSEGRLAGAAFSAGIDNVLDRRYRIHPNGLNQPGIAFKAAASFEF